MNFKDRMIEAVEHGFTTEDNAYDYVRESMADRADAARQEAKLTPRFTVGDRVIWQGKEETWTGYVTSAPQGSDFVFVKLDVGGTFQVPRSELRQEDALK